MPKSQEYLAAKELIDRLDFADRFVTLAATLAGHLREGRLKRIKVDLNLGTIGKKRGLQLRLEATQGVDLRTVGDLVEGFRPPKSPPTVEWPSPTPMQELEDVLKAYHAGKQKPA